MDCGFRDFCINVGTFSSNRTFNAKPRSGFYLLRLEPTPSPRSWRGILALIGVFLLGPALRCC